MTRIASHASYHVVVAARSVVVENVLNASDAACCVVLRSSRVLALSLRVLDHVVETVAVDQKVNEMARRNQLGSKSLSLMELVMTKVQS